MESYQILIRKLDEFIRKYYRNQLLKGVLLFLALFLFSFLLINTLEYLGHFGTFTRTVLFYLFILSTISILYYYIIIPLLKISRIGKIISQEQASAIIGKHFSEIHQIRGSGPAERISLSLKVGAHAKHFTELIVGLFGHFKVRQPLLHLLGD